MKKEQDLEMGGWVSKSDDSEGQVSATEPITTQRNTDREVSITKPTTTPQDTDGHVNVTEPTTTQRY